MQALEKNLAAHVKVLSMEIGARPSGSIGNHMASEYIFSAFEKAGLDVERQVYACPEWEVSQCLLDVEDIRIDAQANAFSPPCDVTASIVPVCSLAELERANLEGCIALLYGDLTQSPLACKSWFLIGERDQRLIELLEAGGVRAVLTVQAVKAVERLIEDWEFHIPSATLPAESGRWFLERLLHGPPDIKGHLLIESRQVEGKTANIVGRLKGMMPKSDRVVVCAHYDTKIDTPGALDNATGISVLIELGKWFSRRFGNQPSMLGLEFVAFAGEEYLPMGDDEYLRRIGGKLDSVQSAVNFDGVGSLVGASTVTAIGGSLEFEQLVDSCRQAFPGVVYVEPWPESNHSTFTFRGVPAVAFSSTQAWTRAHTREDTLAWVSPVKLVEVFDLGKCILEILLDQPIGWGRPALE